MSRVILFAGTSEGRAVSEWLSSLKEKHEVCVATEYGNQVMQESEYASVHTGRMDREQMYDFISSKGAVVVVDATHPYAREVSLNIIHAAEKAKARYIRLDRMAEEMTKTEIMEKDPEGIIWFDSALKCAEYLKGTTGNILLTTGVKDLAVYAEDEAVKNRLTVRVLPGSESIESCNRCGISGKHIIAMQGPFSEEMNIATIRQYDIRFLVSKFSGSRGGFAEKLSAAEKTGIPLLVIGQDRSSLDEPNCTTGIAGYGLEQVKEKLYAELFPKKKALPVNISLIGCGEGTLGSLTKRGADALENARLIFGSQRLLDNLAAGKESHAYFRSEDIIPIICEKNTDTAILFSGDVGFYSGASKVYQALCLEINEGRLNAMIEMIPGVSSVAALAAITGERWDDACIASVHGRGSGGAFEREIIRSAGFNKKTILLVSGAEDVRKTGKLLTDGGLENAAITAGYMMGCENQEIITFKASEYERDFKEGLYTLFIHNPEAAKSSPASAISDDCFIRMKVPMTKEEVRTISISKLNLKEDSVLYDIGCGSGSVGIQAALSVPGVRVVAMDMNPDAVSLTKENSKKMKACSVRVIQGQAPECIDMNDLPVPTHAFIGGSKGHMRKIIERLISINPTVRIVINAVTLETIAQISAITGEYEHMEPEIVCVNISRSQKMGGYNLMKAENPVYICSFGGLKQ